ncbi:MAG TPA: hypothetical protein VFE87_01065 [Candidatus Paceibacterota bacterium]|nr:hypothetical protein [Candidatus Paceibacterota bacterium]
MPDQILTIISTILQNITWLVVLTVFVFIMIDIGKRSWLVALHRKTLAGMKWVLLEITIPRGNLKSAKAMEQVFTSIHSIKSGPFKFWDTWWKGKMEEWISFELVGDATGISFYVRVPAKKRAMVEAAFLSQYPESEIHEAEDYLAHFGETVPNDVYDLFGLDFVLSKDDHLPIRTYQTFEENIEERRIDPLATLFEALSAIRDDETVLMQLLVRGTEIDLKDKADEMISKVMGRPGKAKKATGTDFIMKFITNFVMAVNPLHPAEPAVWGAAKKEDKGGGARPSPGEQDILKAVGNKISKTTFECILRLIYIDGKESFNDSNVTAIQGAIRQFNIPNMNGFKPNFATMTIPGSVGRFGRQAKLLKKKQQLFQAYVDREMPELPKAPGKLNLKTSVYSVEELATIYHPPTTYVGAPNLKHLEAKKGSAPMNLPIVEDYE